MVRIIIKENKGITLIALVVTIIVLLILAGVIIAMLTGENSIINEAQNSKVETEKGELRDELRLTISTATIKGEGKLTLHNLTEQLNKEIGEEQYTLTRSTNEKNVWIITAFTRNGYEVIEKVYINDDGIYILSLKANKIAAGGYHTLALDNEGHIWAWGDNSEGQCGDGTKEEILEPKQIGEEEITYTQIAAGDYHSMALDSEGHVWTWGDNLRYQMGDGTQKDILEPKQIGEGVYTQIVAGTDHCLALDTEGILYGWRRK